MIPVNESGAAPVYVDPAVLPGLLLLAAEFAALAVIGYVVVRVALRQDDERMALAQGLVVGPALWGLIVNFVMYAIPGLAGAGVGWGVVLTLGAVMAWHAPGRLRPRPRLFAGFGVAALALFWIALASRQLLAVPDPGLRLGVAAAIRAGGFPPEWPWSPGTVMRYHYASDLLVGLLAPPGGPNLAFVQELLGAYAWTSFVLVVVTTVLRQAGWVGTIIVSPLLLTPGAWSFMSVGSGILQVPVPAGLPAAGLRASLADIFWPVPPTFQFPEGMRVNTLPDVWNPYFTLGYALAIVVLERVVRARNGSWLTTLTLAALVGFLGLLSTTLVPVVLVLWAGLAAPQVAGFRRSRSAAEVALRSGAGLGLAGLLVVYGGGAFTGVLDGSSPSGFDLDFGLESRHWESLGALEIRHGGVGLLGVGPVAVAGLAALLARRDRIALTLVAGAGLLVLGWLVLSYPPAPWAVNRLAGHARNLALVALLLVLATRLSDPWSPRWRYAAASALLIGLVIWPSISVTLRSTGLAVFRGIEIANAGSVQLESRGPLGDFSGRERFKMPAVSDRVAAYINEFTPVNARVLATEPPYWNVLFATGRPNNSGFVGLVNQIYRHEPGPAYSDALAFLEPAAIRHLGIEYVHATDAWVAGLPARAARWLKNPDLFEPVVRDGSEALYYVRPAFLELEAVPAPESFESLRSAVTPSTLVFLAPQTPWFARLQVASVLSHARLSGEIDTLGLHLVRPAPWTIESLDGRLPDLVVLPTAVEQWTWLLPSRGQRPIWWNEEAAVYAPAGAFAFIRTPATKPRATPVTLRVSKTRGEGGLITFTATFAERAPERWTSQDWIVLQLDPGPLDIPKGFIHPDSGPTLAKWFGGRLSSGSATISQTYRFDARVPELAVQDDEGGAFVSLPAADGDLGVGSWVLAMRLRHEYQPNYWRDAAIVPVLRIRVLADGEVIFELFEDVVDGPVP